MSLATPKVPFSDPPWLNGLPSPYYTESHRKWQVACREFCQRVLLANAREWDDEGLIPDSVFQEFARTNMLIPSLPAPLPVEWLKKLGIHDLLGVVKVEDYDYIHLMIYTDEVY
jgi:acyl-CoA dehydrogenase